MNWTDAPELFTLAEVVVLTRESIGTAYNKLETARFIAIVEIIAALIVASLIVLVGAAWLAARRYAQSMGFDRTL